MRCKAIEVLGQAGGTQVLEPLIAVLKDDDGSVRSKAIEALGAIGGDQAMEPLLAALEDTDPSVRCMAAGVLGKVGGAQAVESLIKVLKYGDPSLMCKAAEALGKLGDSRAVKPLIEAHRCHEYEVRKMASWALDTIAKHGGALAWVWSPYISKISHRDDDLCNAAVRALLEQVDTRRAGSLIEDLRDSDSYVRYKAACALEDFSSVPISDDYEYGSSGFRVGIEG